MNQENKSMLIEMAKNNISKDIDLLKLKIDKLSISLTKEEYTAIFDVVEAKKTKLIDKINQLKSIFH